MPDDQILSTLCDPDGLGVTSTLDVTATGGGDITASGSLTFDGQTLAGTLAVTAGDETLLATCSFNDLLL